MGHAGSWDLYSFANGDPVNQFDPDGRFGKPMGQSSGGGYSHIAEQVERERQFIAGASELVNMIPGLGGLKMWAEMNTGTDLFTGERQYANEYWQATSVFLNFLSGTFITAGLASESMAGMSGSVARMGGTMALGTEATAATGSGTWGLVSAGATTTGSSGAGLGMRMNWEASSPAVVAESSAAAATPVSQWAGALPPPNALFSPMNYEAGGSLFAIRQGLSTSTPQALKARGFQEHHIISISNPLTQNHELLKLAGFDLQSQANKMFLPSNASLHPTRSLHLGRHNMSVSQNLADQMNYVRDFGLQNGWTQQQYDAALRNIISQERQLLRSGQRALNRIARPGAQ